ncbi:MAG: hypothetical protein NDI94_04765 [Candidatus Woesearchaeota archaeon]|nr:hypothetical protein [Candidatus Woesearchaeota archaeon]
MKEKNSEQVLDDFSLEVKKIEEDAAKIIEDAKAEKEHRIVQAKTESISLITKKQSTLEKAKEEKVQRAKAKIDDERSEILKKGKSELKAFETKARKNVPKAVELILKKLDKKVEEL